MNFSEALEKMMAGEFVRRPDWKKDSKYCGCLPGLNTIWELRYSTPNAGNWLPFLEDLRASDWEVLDKNDLFDSKNESESKSDQV